MPRVQQPPSCRFYLTPSGCREGKRCPFLHEGTPPDLEVCKFFLQGSCSRGNYCRFLHPKQNTASSSMQQLGPSLQHPPTPSAPSAPTTTTTISSTMSQQQHVDHNSHQDSVPPEQSAAAAPDHRLPDDLAWLGDEEDDAWDEEEMLTNPISRVKEGTLVDDDELGLASLTLSRDNPRLHGQPSTSAEKPPGDEGSDRLDGSLCQHYLLHGTCPQGSDCHNCHGQYCSTCSKWAIHPFSQHEAASHVDECSRRHERLQARLRSAQVECGICMEKVLAKLNPADRRFGLLQCDHSFCIRCIRNWRSAGEADISAVRACPLCRTFSGFVIPSTVWPETMEEKQAILSMYKDKLSAIRCRHFDEGTCPFGTSCFYSHINPDGTEASKDPNLLRRYVGEEGEVKIQQQVTLSDFIFSTPAGRRMGRR